MIAAKCVCTDCGSCLILVCDGHWMSQIYPWMMEAMVGGVADHVQAVSAPSGEVEHVLELPS